MKLFFLSFYLLISTCLFSSEPTSDSVHIHSINKKHVPISRHLSSDNDRENTISTLKHSFSTATKSEELDFLGPIILQLSNAFAKGSLQNVLSVLFVEKIYNSEDVDLEMINKLFLDLASLYLSDITDEDYISRVVILCESGNLKNLFNDAWIRFYSKA